MAAAKAPPACSLAPGTPVAVETTPVRPDSNFAEFIETCRLERASLTGLIEAIQARRLDPGAPIEVPQNLAAITDATLMALEGALTQLQALLDAYEAAPRG